MAATRLQIPIPPSSMAEVSPQPQPRYLRCALRLAGRSRPGDHRAGQVSSPVCRLGRQIGDRVDTLSLWIRTGGLSRSGFPASQYHPEWVLTHASGGANALWLTEWLMSAIDVRPGMRVLDLGCGRAASSIFLRREFGVQVWATDLWISASENFQRIRDAGVEDGVFPLHADARSLPFAARGSSMPSCGRRVPVLRDR